MLYGARQLACELLVSSSYYKSVGAMPKVSPASVSPSRTSSSSKKKRRKALHLQFPTEMAS